MEINNLIPSSAAKDTGFNRSMGTMATPQGPIVQNASNSEVVADELSALADKLLIARQVISQQVNIALNISSATASTRYPSDTLQASQQSFNHSLADKAVQKIQQEAETIDDKGDEDQHNRAVKTVSILVQQGFDRATTEIKRLGINNTAVADQTSQAQSYVTQAIQQQSTLPAAGEVTNTSPASTVLSQASATRELSVSFQVTTREGDIVTINLSKAQEFILGNQTKEAGSTTIATSSFNSAIEISIEGELNKKEYESIKHIVEQVGGITQKLYNGKTGAAIQKLSELEFNPRQLSDLSMNISSSISYQAMQAYSEISNIPVDSSAAALTPAAGAQPADQATSTPATAGSNSVPETIQNSVSTAEASPQASIVLAVSVARETSEVITQSVTQETFANPFREIRQLFNMLSDLFSSNHQVHSSHHNFIKGLLAGLIDSAENKHTTQNLQHENEDD